MIWDLIVSPPTTPLIREGEHISIKCVRGREVAGLADAQWLEWIYPGQISLEKLEEFYARAFSDESDPMLSAVPDKNTP